MTKTVWTGTARCYKDAELLTSKAGKQYAKVPVVLDVEKATEENEKPVPLFGNLLVFGWSAESAGAVKKGSMVTFLGEAERRTWQADDGPREHWTILCSGFSTAGADQRPGNCAGARRQAAPQQQRRAPSPADDDFAPF